uniref:Peptidase A2 domain-containing protein n=1 Tax=Musca domestica TaxID=7370 RepID=A0A1I8NJ75_MUSDO
MSRTTTTTEKETNICQNSKQPKTVQNSNKNEDSLHDDLIVTLQEILSDLTDDVLKELKTVANKENDEIKDLNNNNKNTAKTKVTKTISKSKDRFKQRKQFCPNIARAIISEYHNGANCIELYINGWYFRGFIDTGTTVTCLGMGCLDFVQRNGLEIFPCYQPYIRTADGQINDIVGTVRINVGYNGHTKPLTVLLVPSLKIRISIGLDVVNTFNIRVSQYVSRLYSSYDYNYYNNYF